MLAVAVLAIASTLAGAGALAGKLDYRGADLRAHDLSGQVLDGAVLTGANLTGANLRGTSLKGADLREGDLLEALQRSPDLPEVDLNEIRVSVAEGVARLEGNTRSPAVNREVERVASSVRGCVAVENRLFSDWEIDLDAASRISRYAPSLLDRVVVKSQFGVLHLEGEVHDEGERQTVTQAVRATPGILDVQWPTADDEEGRDPSP